MFEIILDIAAALIVIYVAFLIICAVLGALGFASIFVFGWISERKEKRKEPESLVLSEEDVREMRRKNELRWQIARKNYHDSHRFTGASVVD